MNNLMSFEQFALLKTDELTDLYYCILDGTNLDFSLEQFIESEYKMYVQFFDLTFDEIHDTLF